MAADAGWPVAVQAGLHLLQEAAAGFVAVYHADEAGVGAQYLHLPAVDGKDAADVAREADGREQYARPYQGPQGSRQDTAQPQRETGGVDARGQAGQQAQQPSAAEDGRRPGPGAQGCLVGGLPGTEQAGDAELQAEVGLPGQFGNGFLAAHNPILVRQMPVQPAGQPEVAHRGAGAVDALEQRVRPEDIEVVGVQMGRVGVAASVVEGRDVALQGGQLLVVGLSHAGGKVALAEQAVVAFHQPGEQEECDCGDAGQCPHALLPADGQRGTIGHHHAQACQTGGVDEACQAVLPLLFPGGAAGVSGLYVVYAFHRVRGVRGMSSDESP